MNDQSPILPPATPFPPRGADAFVSEQEVSDGKALAILGYIFWIVALVLLCLRNNAFTLYHAKQMMTLVVIQFALSIPLMLLVCCGGALVPPSSGHGAPQASAMFPCVLLLVWGTAMLLGMASLAFVIVGIVNAAKGQMKPLPVIGGFAETLFGRVVKKASI